MVKKFIKKIFNNIFSKKVCELYNSIQDYEYVSFDIFDTLIKRNVKNPTDIFNVIEREYDGNVIDFKKRRINAEKKARQKSKYQEVTLREIYEELDYSKEINDKLLKLEIKFEKKFCTTNKEMLELYNYCLKNNKTIFLTSDMYLPIDVVKEILHANGYTKYNKLYLSSDFMVTKFHGNLFEIILKEQKINGKELIHIGDSLKGDYLMPKKYNIKSVLVKEEINNYLFESNKLIDLDYNILTSFIKNNINYNSDKYSKFGYEVLGPILYSFTKWIYKEVQKDKIDKIYFLARDAKIIKNVYDNMFNKNIPTYYINISRKSIILANLRNLQDFDDMYNRLKPLLSRNTNIEDLSKLIKYDIKCIDSKKEIIHLTTEEKEKVFLTIKKHLEALSTTQQKYLRQYLKQNNFCGNIALVDIGWNGTIQKYLENYCDKTTKLFGYYYGINDTNNKKGYLYTNDYNDYLTTIRFSIGLFETMFLSTEPSTIGYYASSKIVYPKLGNNKICFNNSIISKIQDSAILFIEDFIRFDFLDLSKKAYFENYKQIAINPTLREIKMFKNIEFTNLNKDKLINNKNLLYYIFHSKKFINDFKNCYCKTMFLKNVFKIKLPYYKVLKKLYINQYL